MTITIHELRQDTYNFFSKKIKPIFFICFFVTFINIIMNGFIKPDVHIMYIIENNKFISAKLLLQLLSSMNLADKNELLKYSFFKIIQLLISKTLLLGMLITFIAHVSSSSKKSIISSIYSFLLFLPGLFILNCLNSCMIQLGFVLLIIPGILLSMILSLSPIIFSLNKKGLINSIRLSTHICWNNIKIIGPSVLFFMCGKFILTTIFYNMYLINKNIVFFFSNMSVNILFSILTIYLFRFYMIFMRS